MKGLGFRGNLPTRWRDPQVLRAVSINRTIEAIAFVFDQRVAVAPSLEPSDMQLSALRASDHYCRLISNPTSMLSVCRVPKCYESIEEKRKNEFAKTTS